MRARSLSRTDVKLLEKGDNPRKGMLFYLLYTLLKSASFIAAKYLYIINPALNPF
jgi:hypothetical protein